MKAVRLSSKPIGFRLWVVHKLNNKAYNDLINAIDIDTNNIIQPVFAKSKSDMKLIIKFANALKTMSKTQKQELAKRLDNTV